MKKILLKSLSFFLMVGALYASDDSGSNEAFEENLYPLHRAIVNGEGRGVIQSLIDQGCNVNEHCRSEDFFFEKCEDLTPALLAAQEGNLEVLQALYAAGADLNLQEDNDNYTTTPLVKALQWCNFDVVDWLLGLRDAQGNFVVDRRKECKIDGVVKMPLYCLIEALNKYFSLPDQERRQLADNNPDKYMPACLERGEDNNLRIRRNRYPNAAGCYKVLQKLLQEDPSILNTVDSTGKTPLFKAIENRFDPYLISVLCALGADLNIPGPKGVTPLLLTIEKSTGHGVSLVDQLLKKGALPNAMDDEGHNPLVEAIKKERLNSVRDLLHAHANPNVLDGSGTTPLIAAIQKENRYIGQNFEPQDSFDVLLASQQIPVDVNMADAQGFTPLWYACHTDWVYGFASLLRKGATIDRDAYSQGLALRYPFFISFLHTIKSNTPSFDFSTQDVWGDTALMHLLRQKNNYFTEYFLQNNSTFRASVFSANLRGQTPLMIAAQQGSLDMLAKLVADYGAGIDQKDTEGKTVFDYMDEYSVAQGHVIAQMPDDDPKKRHQRQKVKDFLAFKYYLPQLFEQAKEKEIFNDFEQAFNVADRVDARINTQLLSAKERALDLADEIDRGLQLAKRPHLSDQ